MLDSFLYFTLSGSKPCLFEILGNVLLKVMMQGLLISHTPATVGRLHCQGSLCILEHNINIRKICPLCQFKVPCCIRCRSNTVEFADSLGRLHALSEQALLIDLHVRH